MKLPKNCKPTTPRTASVVHYRKEEIFECSNCGKEISEKDAMEDMCPHCMTVFDSFTSVGGER